MSLIASVCCYCGHRQFVGTEILQYRCQLCGQKNELHKEVAITSEKETITSEESSNNRTKSEQKLLVENVTCKEEDKYQSDLINLKLKAVDDRNAKIKDFWDCESIWEGSDQNVLVDQIFDDKNAFELYFSEALIKAKILGPESIEFDLGTTYEFVELRKRGLFGLSGTEIVPIQYVKINFWAREYIPLIVDKLSGGAFRAEFSETPLGSARQYSIEGIESSISVGTVRHSRDVNFTYAIPKALKCKLIYQEHRPLPEWIMRTWPMIEHLKNTYKDDLEALKATQLISDICEECSAFNLLHELKPKSQRTHVNLFKTGYGSALSSPVKLYSASLGHVNIEEYRELSIDEVMLIALALDSIPDFDYYIGLDSGDERKLSIIRSSDDKEYITMTSASKDYPPSSKSVIEELISA